MEFKRRFILRILESAAFVAFVCGVIWLVFNKSNIGSNPEVLTKVSIADMYFTQVSVSFIIISLVSVLTNVSKPVYWVDITQYKLIEPKHTAFIDFAAYILSTLIVSSLLLIFKSNYIVVSFGFSILFMMLLTIKMIGAYFGRDSVKIELQKELQALKNAATKKNNDYSEELGTLSEAQEANNMKETEIRVKARKRYAEICSELEDKTYQEIDNKEYKLVSENLDLLVSHDEFGIVIDILRYISENMVNIYCKYAERYLKNVTSLESDEYSHKYKNRFFQLAYTSLMRSIEENDLQDVSVCLYSLLLMGRFSQFTKRELENNRFYSRGPYWKRIELALASVYETCINDNKYDLLDEFLYSFFSRQMNFRRRLIYMEDRKIVGKLYALYAENLGLETISKGLIGKVNEGQIDYRQINMLIRSLTKIYKEVEVVGGKIKDDLDPDQLSKEIYDEEYVQLIELTYKNKLLDKRIRLNDMRTSKLKAIFDRIYSE